MKKNINILAVCSFGIGTSLLLKMDIEKILEEVGVEGNVENCDVATMGGYQPDLVVTSEYLVDDVRNVLSCEIISVESFTDKVALKNKLTLFLDKKC